MKKLLSLILMAGVILILLLNMPSNLLKTDIKLTADKEFASIPPVPAPRKKPPQE